MIDEFENYLYIKTDYDFNTINKLWNYYNKVLNNINYTEESDEMFYYESYNKFEARCNKQIDYDLIDTLIFVYNLVSNKEEYLIISLVDTLLHTIDFLNNLCCFYFEKEMIDITKETIYEKMQLGLDELGIENSLEKECKNYLEIKVENKIEKTYQENYVYEFFEEDFKNIDEEVLETLKFFKIVEEAYDVYEYLINLDFFKDIPKHYIKNVVSFCYHEQDFIYYDFDKKINFCLAVINFKNIKNIKDINEIIYNFFNNEKIDRKFKDKYFIFGIVYFAEDIEICELNKNDEFYKGKLYFQNNHFDDSYMQSLLDSIYNYWNDLDIKNCNKDFQLGIIYEGIKNIQENLEYWVDDDYEKDLTLRKIL